MALGSIYAELPGSEPELINHADHAQASSRLIRSALAYAAIIAAAIGLVVILAAIPVYDVSIHASMPSDRFQRTEADLPPPILVVKPEMKRIHYCGLDPDNPQSVPRIPPLTNPDYELVQVQAFIRHGARFINAPAKCWPGQENIVYNCSLSELATVAGDAHRDSASVSRLYRMRYLENRNFFKGNCRLGQLTLDGHRQEVALGKLFRDTYMSRVVNPDLGPEQIFIRAHDIPRTIMSAQAFATGMFPEHSSDRRHVPLVDIWTMDSNEEDEVINPHECPGVEEQRKQALQSPDFIRHEATITAQLNEKLSAITGVPPNELGTNKFDCLFISLCRGDPVPDGVDMDLMHMLENEARYNLYYLMQFPDRIRGSRLTIGPLLYEILDQMKAVDSVPRFSLYSGHDSGPIMLLLSAFGVEDEYWAPLASYISLELYRRQGQHFVRFVYNGKALHMPFGGDDESLVALQVLEEYLAPMLPTSEECPQMHRFD